MAEIMTLKDLAGYLRMNERTIAKLAHEGKVPGIKVASQWRFSKETIDAWFAQQTQAAEITEAAGAEKQKIAALLAPEAIALDLASRTKDGILSEMTEMLVNAKRVSGGSALLAALRDRERLCSTGVGRGIAFLHPRHIIPEIVMEPVLAFGRSREGVRWEAVDGEKVHFFFLDCAPTDRLHLAILARLSRVLADDAVVGELARADKQSDVVEAVARGENRLVDMQS